MQEIIITGASGFIGQSISNTLIKDKESRVLLISKSQTIKPYIYIEKFDDVPSGDVLIHLAETSNRNTVNNLGNNYIKETGDALEKLLKKNFKKVIYFSSSSVYGNLGNKPFKENDKVLKSDIYNTSKLINERKILEYGGIVVRVSNVIGPKMSANNVLSEIISQIKIGNKIIVKNNKPIIDFLWHQVLANEIVKLINSNITGPNIFNIGTGIGTSINEIAKEASHSAGKNIEITSLERNSLPSYNVVNISKISKLINWSPLFKITEIIGEMIKK